MATKTATAPTYRVERTARVKAALAILVAESQKASPRWGAVPARLANVEGMRTADVRVAQFATRALHEPDRESPLWTSDFGPKLPDTGSE